MQAMNSVNKQHNVCHSFLLECKNLQLDVIAPLIWVIKIYPSAWIIPKKKKEREERSWTWKTDENGLKDSAQGLEK